MLNFKGKEKLEKLGFLFLRPVPFLIVFVFLYAILLLLGWASQVVLVVEKLPANVGDVKDAGLIPGLGRSSGGEHGNPLQYSCLENPMDRGAWWASVHRVTKSQTLLK